MLATASPAQAKTPRSARKARPDENTPRSVSKKNEPWSRSKSQATDRFNGHGSMYNIAQQQGAETPRSAEKDVSPASVADGRRWATPGERARCGCGGRAAGR